MVTTTAKTALLGTSTATGDAMSKAESLKACTVALEKMVTAVRSTFQSLDKMEPAIHAAMVPALRHAQLYKDARPVDRIVRSLIDISKASGRLPQGRILVAELRAWVRSNSPIRWEGKDWTDAKVNVSGKNEFTPDDAEKTAFYQTEAATKARTEAARNTENALAPITPQVALNRLKGMLTWFNRAKAEIDPTTKKPRQIVNAGKIEKALKAAVETAEETFTAKDLAATAPVDEKQVQKNITLLKKGSRAHRKATKARKAA